jgi:hypothetical protein
VRGPEPGHAQPEHGEPYRVDGHHHPADKAEEDDVALSPALHVRQRQGKRDRQEDEPGGELVLGDAGDELPAVGELRGAEMGGEEQHVKAAREQRGGGALEEVAGESVEGQQGHQDQGRS